MGLFKKDKVDSTDIWKRYENGVDWHHKNNLYSDTDLFYSMFEGDQWKGIDSGDERLSQHNFIQPICEYKIALVAMNNMVINYSPLNSGPNQEIFRQSCDMLNQFAASKWELKKMDSKVWEVIKQACIGGDSYLFFYNSALDSQIIDRTNIYLSDEQEKDIQKQKYILIYERRFVDDVKEEARANGLPEEEVEMIVSDNDTDTLPDNVKSNEVKNTDKCSGLLYMTKKKLSAPHTKPYGIYVARSTQTVVYQPETLIEGLTLYPIVNMLWSTKRGSARGIGEVEPLVNNQINANKLLARRELNLKQTGFAKPVYNMDLIDNPSDVEKVGSSIRIKGHTAQRVDDAFKYVAPSPMSGDAKTMQDELIEVSRNLASAGDNATGNINPERASGAAIIAVKDQQAVNSTQNISAYKQFNEDVANVWLDMWIAYNPNGLTIDLEEEGEVVQQTIDAETLKELQVNIRIDISPTNPYSKFAREQALENALAQQHITFEEYVEALDDDGTAPKGKFEDILERRAEKQQLIDRLTQAETMLEQQSQALQGLMGGEPNVMPGM